MINRYTRISKSTQTDSHIRLEIEREGFEEGKPMYVDISVHTKRLYLSFGGMARYDEKRGTVDSNPVPVQYAKNAVEIQYVEEN
jgi:hypothetical protein